MHNIIKTLLVLVITGGVLNANFAKTTEMTAVIQSEAPKVEVLFLLDTTGSMSSLIQAAKGKIWAIANTLSTADPAPEIKMGIISYRDRGDQYITKITPLTTDIDSLYSNLMDFSAAGGGDSPESVNQALFEGVNKIEWSKDKNTYKVIFLIGDAPPHMDYDEVQYEATGKKARVYYGSAEEKKKIEERNKKAEKIYSKGRKTAIAQRCSYNASSAGKENFLGRNELVDAMLNKKVKIEDIKKEHLPVNMQAMSFSERKQYLEGINKEREEIRKEIQALGQKRQKHILEQVKKENGKGKDSLDMKIYSSIRAQAKEKKIKYEGGPKY